MTPPKSLRDLLSDPLKSQGLELVEFREVPMRGGAEMRIRTLEDLVGEFERGAQDGSVCYVLRARKPGAPLGALAAPMPAPHVNESEIYRPDGKLNIQILERNARMLLGAGEHHLAKNIFTAILKSGEHRSESLAGIGRCLEVAGDLQGAQKAYEDSIAFSPCFEAFTYLAALLVRQGKDEYAVEVYERMLRIEDLTLKNKFEIHKACGNSLLRLGRYDASEVQFKKALNVDPQAAEIQSNLGSLYLTQGKIDLASRAFSDAIASNPTNGRAHFGLGCCYLATANKRGAHDCFARSLKIEPNNSTAIFHLVKLAYELKDYAIAERFLTQYTENAPVSANLLYSLAGLRFHLGRKDEARLLAEKILTLKKDHVGAGELLKLV